MDLRKIELRGYQRAAVEAVVNEMKRDERKPFLVVEPCGAGKSYEIAGFIQALSRDNPEFRMLVITPSAELVVQDYRAIVNVIGPENVGIDSRKVGHQTTHKKVTVSNINTIYRDYQYFDKMDLIIIDEAHQIRQNDSGAVTMYRKVEAYFRKLNPNLGIVGLTATPYRLSEGIIYGENRFFSRIVHETKFSALILGGFLSPLYCHLPNFSTDFTKAELKFNGEFSDNSWKLIDTDKAIDFMLKRAEKKKKVLIFAATTEQAELIKNGIEQRTGEFVGLVTSDTDPNTRTDILDRFCSLKREDKIKYVVNILVLRQGFDNPAIDMVVLFRPTKSAALYVQMCCRGSRKSPSTRKTKCEILDFGGNVERHGFIDEIEYPENGIAPNERVFNFKKCPNCGALNSMSAKYCSECQYAFVHGEHKSKVELSINADNQVMSENCAFGMISVDEFTQDGKYLNTYSSIEAAARATGEQVESIMYALDLCDKYPGVKDPVNKWNFAIINIDSVKGNQ